MKIAIWHNTGTGGARGHLYNHVKGLLSRGHILEAWCPSSASEDYLPLSKLISEHRHPLGWERRNRRGWLASTAGLIVDTPRMLRAVDASCRAAAEEINKGQFDLLLATNCIFSSVAPIARYVNCPTAMYLHEPRRNLYEARPELPWVPNIRPPKWEGIRNSLTRGTKVMLGRRNARLFAGHEIRNAAAYDQLLVNSYFTRESALAAYNVDSRVCYQGIDTTLFCDQNKPRERFLLGVGEYSEHKDIHSVINSVLLLSEPRPRIVWVGNGGSKSYLNDLRRAVEPLGVEFEALFGVKESELVDLYNRACALVYTPKLEPFGLAALEANACGVPVIAVAEGGIRETVQDGVNGILVNRDDREISDAIQRLLDDESLGAEIGKRGRAIVEKKWSLSASLDRLESELTRVIKEAKRD